MISRFFLCALLVVAIQSDRANAQIDGFSNFSKNWTYNQLDSGSPAAIGADFIDITNGAAQARNIWFNTRQPISEFSASFRYETDLFFSGAGFDSPGLSFVVHNSPSALEASANSNSGAGFNGIEQSLAVVFRLLSNGRVMVSIQRDGSVDNSGSDLGDRTTFDEGLDVTLTYDGALLNLMIDDGIEEPFVQTLIVSPDIAESLGSGDAIIGFGASTNGNFILASVTRQTISDFQFESSGELVIGDLELGDVNQNGVVDFFDIQPFIDLLAAQEFQAEADIDGNGVVNFFDIAPFIGVLSKAG